MGSDVDAAAGVPRTGEEDDMSKSRSDDGAVVKRAGDLKVGDTLSIFRGAHETPEYRVVSSVRMFEGNVYLEYEGSLRRTRHHPDVWEYVLEPGTGDGEPETDTGKDT